MTTMNAALAGGRGLAFKFKSRQRSENRGTRIPGPAARAGDRAGGPSGPRVPPPACAATVLKLYGLSSFELACPLPMNSGGQKTPAFLTWLSGCCSPNVTEIESKQINLLTPSQNFRGNDTLWANHSEAALVPRNYNEITEEVQFFSNEDAPAGVGIIFQSTIAGY
jgi:hypothetical protein